MKVAIIGAGNMGGAIARGLAQGSLVKCHDIIVSDLSQDKLSQLQTDYPEVKTTTNNQKAVDEANLIFLVVKPWLVKSVLEELHFPKGKVLISVASGVEIKELSEYLSVDIPIYRMIPNTAISELAGVCLLSSSSAVSSELTHSILNVLNEMGMAMLIPESKLAAATALTSCGIAYVFKYVEASVKAGVELGFSAQDSIRMISQTIDGAAKILLNNETHPSLEIDKVTTPGGITIKGINELEHAGFVSAIIRAIKASS